MKKHDIFKSKYLVAADLKDGPVVLTIDRAVLTKMKGPGGGPETQKLVLHFRGTNKTLPLNLTNFESVADATGADDSDGWPECRIECYATTTEMGGKVVDCVRIRRPAELPLTKNQPSASLPRSIAGDMDDVIPF